MRYRHTYNSFPVAVWFVVSYIVSWRRSQSPMTAHHGGVYEAIIAFAISNIALGVLYCFGQRRSLDNQTCSDCLLAKWYGMLTLLIVCDCKY